MEVFDTDLGKWTSLPNPPSQINSDHMISAITKKEIIVSNPSTSMSSFTSSVSQSPRDFTGSVSQSSGDDDGYELASLGDDETNLEHWDECEDGDFFTYNINDGSWNGFKNSLLNVDPNAGRIAVTGGEGLYWRSFVDDDQYEWFILLLVFSIYKIMIFFLLLQSSMTHPASHCWKR